MDCCASIFSGLTAQLIRICFVVQKCIPSRMKVHFLTLVSLLMLMTGPECKNRKKRDHPPQALAKQNSLPPPQLAHLITNERLDCHFLSCWCWMLIKIKNCCKKAVNFTTRASTCLLATVYWPWLFRRVIIAGVESASIVLQGPILGSLSAFYTIFCVCF